jgi:hypothetical protein
MRAGVGTLERTPTAPDCQIGGGSAGGLASFRGGVSEGSGNDLPQARAASTLRGSNSFPRPRPEMMW